MNGLLKGRTADSAVDSSLVYVNGLLEDRTADRSVNNGFVNVDGLLVGRSVVMVVVVMVVMMTVVVTVLNNGFGYAHVFAVTGLITSTIFTLDLVDGRVVLLGNYGLGTTVVVMVVSVCVNFNTCVRIRRASGSEKPITLAVIFATMKPTWLAAAKKTTN